MVLPSCFPLLSLDQIGSCSDSPMLPRSRSPNISAMGVDTAQTHLSTTFRWLSIIIPGSRCCVCPKGSMLLDTPHDSLNSYVVDTSGITFCICEAQLCDHIANDNLYRSAEPWNVLDYFPYSNSPSSYVDGSSDKSPFTSNSTTSRNFTPAIPAPVSSDYIVSCAFNPFPRCEEFFPLLHVHLPIFR